ncbi:MAG: GNAT family N-acetyltransferase [Thaumarchaeota archaeon]|nr:GNAT family N-acetyltransferase [Nitrososphaerota archaeon]
MSETIAIRNGTKDDLAPILEIENKSFDDPFTLDLFVTLLGSFPEGFRVSTVRERIVGYCVTYPMKQKRAMVIVSIAVHPDFRDRGMGSNLLKDSISIANKFRDAKMIDKLILQVAEDNKAARSLYTKFGFQNHSLMRNYYGRRKNGIEMELNLKR